MKKIQDKIVYRFTNHFRQRYYERIIQQEWKGQSLIDSEISRVFYATPEHKSWQNNQYFVEYLKSKYGNCKVKIHLNDDIVFISRRDEKIVNLYYVVTCFKPTEFQSFFGKKRKNCI